MRRSPARPAVPALLPAVLLAILLAMSLGTTGCSDAAAPTPAAVEASTSGTPEPELLPGGPGDPVSTASGPVDVPVPGWSHSDLAFVQMMVPHHRQALEMAALAPDRTTNPAVLALASRIDAAQAPEVLLMAGWLEEQGVAVPQAGDDPAMWDHASHGHDGMAGMLAPAEMVALREAHGTEFDRLFLTGMIGHHEGALEMARDEMRGGTAPRVLELADDVNAGQAAEIARMRTLLAQLER